MADSRPYSPNVPSSQVSIPPETDALAETAYEVDPQEVECVRSARSGDAEAFGRLVRKYHRRAISVAYRLLGNAEDANDVSQDAFVRAFRSLGQLEDPARFMPWLTRIVCNLSLNYRRSRKRRAATSLDEAGGIDGNIDHTVEGARLPQGNGGEEGLLSEEVNGAVSRAIASLPEHQRLALILFSVEGMPQRQVAEVLDCSVELVKWNVFQARKKLKELLADYL
jgi:RNA polymerase sigma-70 factor, ECF subfamily